MGCCFLRCFGSSKDRKRQKQRNKIIPSRDQLCGNQNPLQTVVFQEQGITEKPTSSVSELIDKPEEQLSLNTRKIVTFDSNLKTSEHASVCESTDSLLEKEKWEIFAKSNQSNPPSEDGSITSSVGSYPPNHRYQNCQESDNEVEELYEDSDLDDEDDYVEEQEDYQEDNDCEDKIVCQEDWFDSIPNEESKTIGLMNRNARDRSVYVHPVLNPIENLTQWKAVKSKGTSLKPQKENFGEEQEGLPRISFSSEPSFKQSSFSFKTKSHQPKNPNQEISVDASLSSWLVSSETTPTNKVSSFGIETTSSEKSMFQSIEDRPILGALTIEELRQFSASNSPRKSPSRSPDEMPIIGTVGTYWSHTGPASSYKGKPKTNSKYR